jgi:hypothetical protein
MSAGYCYVCGGVHELRTRIACPTPSGPVAPTLHRCPVCNGTGRVSTPPWVADDLALARAVLNAAREVDDKPGEVLLAIDRPAWRRWQGQEGA